MAGVRNETSNTCPIAIYIVQLQTGIQITGEEMIVEAIDVSFGVVPLKLRRNSKGMLVRNSEVKSDEMMVRSCTMCGVNLNIGYIRSG